MYNIILRKYSENLHKEFIELCMEKNLYKNISIDGRPPKYENTYIFEKDGGYLGFTEIFLESDTGINIVKPTIYFWKRMTKESLFMVYKMLDFVFNNISADIIYIPIFESNFHMLNIVKNFKLPYMGKMRKYDSQDVLYYSMDRKLYKKMCTDERKYHV